MPAARKPLLNRSRSLRSRRSVGPPRSATN